MIDFGFAATDAFAYDLAIAVNDWCTIADGEHVGALDPPRVEAMTNAYGRARPFDEEERTAWPSLLRAAALRFWLSRLHDFHLPRPGMLVHAHDPEHFRRILECRRAS